jgi:hypothetical protein
VLTLLQEFLSQVGVDLALEHRVRDAIGHQLLELILSLALLAVLENQEDLRIHVNVMVVLHLPNAAPVLSQARLLPLHVGRQLLSGLLVHSSVELLLRGAELGLISSFVVENGGRWWGRCVG